MTTGNLLFIFVVYDGGNDTLTVPASFTLIAGDNFGGITTGLYWHVVDGTETGTWNLGCSSAEMSSVIQMEISGAADPTITPPEAVRAGGSDTNVDPTTLTPSWGTDDTLWYLITAWDNGTTTHSGFPLPDNQGTVTNGLSNGTGIMYCGDELSQSALDPTAFTLTETRSFDAYTIGFAPGLPTTTIQVPTGPWR